MTGLAARVPAEPTPRGAFERLAAFSAAHQDHGFGCARNDHGAASGLQDAVLKTADTLLIVLVVEAEHGVQFSEALQPVRFLCELGAERLTNVL